MKNRIEKKTDLDSATRRFLIVVEWPKLPEEVSEFLITNFSSISS